ncbi:MAG TPA: SGNH/GDSL hydrolase family protein [Ottowia sp.]|nr:SGNH/GDSL hydrolase family protein [Ottowia sp.]
MQFTRGMRACLGMAALAALGFLAGWWSGGQQQGRVAEERASAAQRGHLLRKDRNSEDGRVVFLGSSTFQGMDVSSISPRALNMGLGGDTIESLQARSANYRSIARASAVVVNVGLNNLVRDCALPPSTLENLMSSWPAGVPVVVVGVQGIAPARRRERCDGQLGPLVRAWNAQQAAACAARPNCRYVGNPVPAEPSDDDAGALLEADGIHLSASAYGALKATICGGLMQALGQQAVACRQ